MTMALIIRKSVLGVVVVAIGVYLAVGSPAHAVNLKSLVGKGKEPIAFTQVSLAAATKLEMQAALQAAIQEAISEQIGEMIEDEVKKSDVFDNVKGVAKSALGDMLGSLRQSMEQTCKRLASVAQEKLDSVDDKLKRIAAGEESDGGHGPAAVETNHSAVPAQSAAQLSAGSLAFLQLELRNKHKGFFDTMKSFARKGFNKVKSTVKTSMKFLWGSIQPAVTSGVRSAVAHMSAHVPALIGDACDRAESKLEHLESKVVGDNRIEDLSDDSDNEGLAKSTRKK